ncbi:MAG: HypC/HybG/HupF family hydrogenase formation chaperone [Paludibacterium sp.]|uniref:HypC/HybG/HupF family hydrogenase formation chaperone n=1 Tax=Paludibacterium sp. TaxID=1917523 RepID=UPI002600E062|nr:HypC/HybG/HupF family hydrogenase formation chaperone [Paludibacterium sp.]MBV8047918.1 HypC/HybG/HupF family hydrogenase formation chaperone [Paludibacterium sp.]MBV8647670.1 HypC/HybG/HupF family hydrogenase formation chaperone [Paludibacterium sp.]
MCLGIPMQVVQAGEFHAQCRHGDTVESVDLTLIGAVTPGDWLLVFAGAAREALTPQQADDIGAALAALEAAMNGSFDPDIHLAGLGLGEPQLPPHLAAQDKS